MIYKQYNGQKKKDQGTNNNLQTEGQTIQWTKKKDQGTNNDLQTEGQTTQRTKEKGQTTIYNTLHIKQKIE
jgi:hypothetical protein